MMTPVRWVKVKWPTSLRDISKKLLDDQYDDERGFGFILSKSNSQCISGKFVEKSTVKTVVVDPFGSQTESVITSYYVCKFYINNTSNLLELYSPPRSLRKFISRMHRLVGLGMEMSDVCVDPLVWTENIERKLSKVSVCYLSGSGITVPKNGLAKISVAGKTDIRTEFNKLLKDRACIIDSVKFNGLFDDCNITAELTKAGSARITGNVYDGFIEEVRECLEASLSESPVWSFK